jgi:hypothetical protein
MKEIELTQGKVALVDDEDYEYLSQWNWYTRKTRHTCYAVRNYYADKDLRVQRPKLMHRAIFEGRGVELNMLGVDHINGNGLDNRWANLRPANDRDNARNRRRQAGCVSKGVYLFEGRCWRAQIHVVDKQIYLGYYHSREDAEAAYDAAATRYFGEFAKTNYDLYETVECPTSRSLSNFGKKFKKKRRNATSKYRGVSYRSDTGKWCAFTTVNGKKINFGCYSTEDEAARAYNDTISRYHGKDAILNKLQPEG